MQYQEVNSQKQLKEFCDSLRDANVIAFDTEFVAEDTYRPDLCLIQVAGQGELAVIDTLAVDDITPFWEMLVEGEQLTLVHAGREELRFCLHSVGARPKNLFDVQLAAGFIGLEYPISYGNLIQKLLGKSLNKGETRTNWRNRPLSSAQTEYALQDVLYLEQLHGLLLQRLTDLDRVEWVKHETILWQDQVEAAESTERWRRLSGLSGLSSRMLAVVRELWQWRDQEAQRRNSPAKRVLRDDLLIELSKRKTASVQRIRALRGLEHKRLQRHLPEISKAIQFALDLPDDDCPAPIRRSHQPQFSLLTQFLNTALSSICRKKKIAPSLVGTVQDVRDLIMRRLEISARGAPVPALMAGWRAAVVGDVLTDVMDGKVALRVDDPNADFPLTFERLQDDDSEKE